MREDSGWPSCVLWCILRSLYRSCYPTVPGKGAARLAVDITSLWGASCLTFRFRYACAALAILRQCYGPLRCRSTRRPAMCSTIRLTPHGCLLWRSQNIYSRIQNPTNDILEQRVAALEQGVAAVAFSSGMAAITAALLTLCGPGDEIVASTRLYGGTVTLLSGQFQRLGIKTVWVDSDDAEGFEAALTERTRAVYLETIGNPRLAVPDLSGIASVAHRAGVPVVVDNTTASPALCRPLTFGADIVVHSLTKYLNGHGNSIGGIVVDGGQFPGTMVVSRVLVARSGLSWRMLHRAIGAAAFAARCRTGCCETWGRVSAPLIHSSHWSASRR